MKVLLLSAYAYPLVGGIETSLMFVGRELLNRGCEVRLLCFRSPKNLSEYELAEGIHIHRIEQRSIRFPPKRIYSQVNDVEKALRQLIVDFDPDFVWSRYMTFGVAATKLFDKKKIFHIFSTTALLSNIVYQDDKNHNLIQRVKNRILFNLIYRPYHSLEAKLLKCCNGVVFSEFMLNQLKLEYGKSCGQIEVVRPGVDSDFFRPASSNTIGRCKSSLGLSNERILVYVGRIAKEKNLHILIEALGNLPNDVHLIIVGKGLYEREIKSLVSGLGLDQRVHFVGSHKQELPIYYSVADICVLPTYVETFGQTYIEAMSCETAVVGFSSRCPGCRNASDEIIKNGVNGFLVEEIGAEALAAKLKTVLTNLDIIQVGREARRNVLKKYSWSNFVDTLLTTGSKCI